jgi:hypothetical protein
MLAVCIGESALESFSFCLNGQADEYLARMHSFGTSYNVPGDSIVMSLPITALKHGTSDNLLTQTSSPHVKNTSSPNFHQDK